MNRPLPQGGNQAYWDNYDKIFGKKTYNKHSCWFCGGTDKENLELEPEIDHAVHKTCVVAALESDRNHPEAWWMRRYLSP